MIWSVIMKGMIRQIYHQIYHHDYHNADVDEAAVVSYKEGQPAMPMKICQIMEIHPALIKAQEL